MQEKKRPHQKNYSKKKQRIAKKAYDLVSQCIEKYPQVVGFELGGSYAKDTWVSEKPVDKVDIDIFVKFNKETSEKDFRNIGTKIGFESLKKFKPHVTIFRVKKKIENITNDLQKFSSYTFGSLFMKEFKLKKSTLTPNGPIYTDLLVVCGK